MNFDIHLFMMACREFCVSPVMVKYSLACSEVFLLEARACDVGLLIVTRRLERFYIGPAPGHYGAASMQIAFCAQLIIVVCCHGPVLHNLMCLGSSYDNVDRRLPLPIFMICGCVEQINRFDYNWWSISSAYHVTSRTECRTKAWLVASYRRSPVLIVKLNFISRATKILRHFDWFLSHISSSWSYGSGIPAHYIICLRAKGHYLSA